MLARIRNAAEIEGVGYQGWIKDCLTAELDRVEANGAPLSRPRPEPPKTPKVPKPLKKPKPPKPQTALPGGLTDDDLEDMLKDVDV